MKMDMVVPALGESINEATILKWRKRAGETVQRDEVILEVATDKVDSDIPAPASGVLAEILHGEGDVVAINARVAVIDTAPAEEGKQGQEPPAAAFTDETAEPTAEPEAAPAPEAGPAAEAVEEAAIPKVEPAFVEPPPADSSAPPAAEGEASAGRRFYSPLVRSLAAKYGIPLSDLDAIQGSGQGGRVAKQDLMRLLEQRGVRHQPEPPIEEPPRRQPRAEKPRDEETAGRGDAGREPEPQSRPSPAVSEHTRHQPPAKYGDLAPREDDTIVPMDSIRRSIAEHMVRSKHTSPHVYTIHEVDMTNVGRWRAEHQAEFTEKEGFRLSFTPFILEAAVKALLRFPYVNSSLEGSNLHLKRHINLGCAVALEPLGLIVPVIKRAEERNLVGLARALQDLALRARERRLLPDEVAGGTFTVTNPGVFGTLIGTPIINQPQAAILCIGAIEKRPVVIDEMLAVRSMCYLTLSYDHRIIDGATSGRFLAFVGDYLEQWEMSRTLY